MSNYNVDSYETILKASKDLEELKKLTELRTKILDKDYDEDSMFSSKPIFKEWLLRGSIILTSHGGILPFIPKDKNEKFPEVMEFDHNILKGDINYMQRYDIPLKGTHCSYCGKEITIDDFYNHTYLYHNNQIMHKENCLYYHSFLYYMEKLPPLFLRMCYRVLGDISNITIKQGDQREKEKQHLLTIEFTSHDVKFKIIIFNHITEVKVMCTSKKGVKTLVADKDAINTHFLYISNEFEDAFKEAVTKYFEENK